MLVNGNILFEYWDVGSVTARVTARVGAREDKTRSQSFFLRSSGYQLYESHPSHVIHPTSCVTWGTPPFAL